MMEHAPAFTNVPNTIIAQLQATLSSSSLSKNVNLVGSAWMVSSAIFTTYSTTTFLKYRHPPSNMLVDQKGNELLTKATTSAVQASNEKSKMSSFYLDRPTLLTFYRFSGSLLLSLLLPSPQYFRARLSTIASQIPSFFLPATCLFIANYFNSIALDRIGISLTYTSKCGIPLITLLLSILIDGKSTLPSKLTLLSLLPIAFGIGAASWNAPQFETTGFIAAVISCIGQSALTVSCKRAMKKLSVGGLEAQRVMVAVALVYAVLLSAFKSVFGHSNATDNGDDARELSQSPPWGISLMAMVAYHLEYCLSFIFVNLVEPITFGTCDAIRRLMIIIAGQKMFKGKKFTFLNLAGMGCALAGALMYAVVSAK